MIAFGHLKKFYTLEAEFEVLGNAATTDPTAVCGRNVIELMATLEEWLNDAARPWAGTTSFTVTILTHRTTAPGFVWISATGNTFAINSLVGYNFLHLNTGGYSTAYFGSAPVDDLLVGIKPMSFTPAYYQNGQGDWAGGGNLGNFGHQELLAECWATPEEVTALSTYFDHTYQARNCAILNPKLTPDGSYFASAWQTNYALAEVAVTREQTLTYRVSVTLVGGR